MDEIFQSCHEVCSDVGLMCSNAILKYNSVHFENNPKSFHAFLVSQGLRPTKTCVINTMNTLDLPRFDSKTCEVPGNAYKVISFSKKLYALQFFSINSSGNVLVIFVFVNFSTTNLKLINFQKTCLDTI